MKRLSILSIFFLVTCSAASSLASQGQEEDIRTSGNFVDIGGVVVNKDSIVLVERVFTLQGGTNRGARVTFEGGTYRQGTFRYNDVVRALLSTFDNFVNLGTAVANRNYILFVEPRSGTGSRPVATVLMTEGGHRTTSFFYDDVVDALLPRDQ